MNSYFKNKVVVVTGASSGIGNEIVNHLMQFEANIVLCARNEKAMLEIVQTKNHKQENYLIYSIDFSQSNNYDELKNAVISKFGKIDILIHNAGIAQKSLAQETNEEVERRIMEVNYFAPVLLTKAILPQMIKQGKGQIIAISSILGEIGLPNVAPYCASKHALNGYFESLRYDVEKLGVDVSIIEPGFIKTDITKKSLTGDGKVHNQDSVAQEKGMDAKQCAYGILKHIKNKTWKGKVGGLETFMPNFAYYFPRLFHYLMRKMHKI